MIEATTHLYALKSRGISVVRLWRYTQVSMNSLPLLFTPNPCGDKEHLRMRSLTQETEVLLDCADSYAAGLAWDVLVSASAIRPSDVEWLEAEWLLTGPQEREECVYSGKAQSHRPAAARV